ncbi:MAG TPA: ATP-binding protein [bacterium]|nr:ATP-binding protein [bacterium]
MIRVDSINIKEFRGIRDLTLNLKGKNFAICGPNGTGKSGVVDALEFALTGSISRLSGEGKGEVSLKAHGPHVDQRNDPDKARVKVQITIPSLNKAVTIERSVKTPTAPVITPSDPDVLNVLQHVKVHPEIVLSRRELIRYVLATPGERAQEVQALLHLDRVEQVRSTLLKIANSCDKQVIPQASAVTQARDNLMRALGIAELTTAGILEASNAQRALLGLAAFTELSESVSLKDGMSLPEVSHPSGVPKVQALADIRVAHEFLKELGNTSTQAIVSEVVADLRALADDSAVEAGVKLESFYTMGIGFVEGGSCPFCDDKWDLVELRQHVQGKIDHLKAVTEKRKAIEDKLVPLISLLRDTASSQDRLIRLAQFSRAPLVMVGASNFSTYCKEVAERLTTILPLASAIELLLDLSIPDDAISAISSFEALVSALPEPNTQQGAREWLTIAQERLQVWRESVRLHEVLKERAENARRTYNVYVTTSDNMLTGLYVDVERDFSNLYRFTNRDDEDNFNAKIVPSMGKLGFDVDFYGRGFFPPGAYHSEGHQDSMGLCLYLALMRHTQGTGFTFAVLDDVLMSVDAGHRREVCTLLKSEFPDTQFVLTTHDQVWLRHMKTEGFLSNRSAVLFRNWCVDLGPAQWEDKDVWVEIDGHLENNDIRAAAALLRHYLEYVSAELCHRLRAPVEFRGDAQYQLGELLPQAIAQIRTLLKRANEAASSWNQQEVLEKLSERKSTFDDLVKASQTDSWQVNTAVHYNSWDSLGEEDFAPVAKAYRELLNCFICLECGEFLRVLPDRETAESLRCDCGIININLKKKP